MGSTLQAHVSAGDLAALLNSPLYSALQADVDQDVDQEISLVCSTQCSTQHTALLNFAGLRGAGDFAALLNSPLCSTLQAYVEQEITQLRETVAKYATDAEDKAARIKSVVCGLDSSLSEEEVRGS